jgi:hypothetical protein
MLQEELAGERLKAFPMHGLREELHPSVPAQYPSCSGTGNYFKRRSHEIQNGVGVSLFGSLLLWKKISRAAFRLQIHMVHS